MVQVLSRISILLVVVLVSFASATTPVPSTTKPSYVFTPHARAVAKICWTVTEKRLCCKTLKYVKSDEAIDLIKTSALVAQQALKDGTKYVSGLVTLTDHVDAAIRICKDAFADAEESMQTFIDKIGDDVVTLGNNYSDLKNLIRGVWLRQSHCLDNIMDADYSAKVGAGIAGSRNHTGNVLDMTASMPDIFTAFGITATLN